MARLPLWCLFFLVAGLSVLPCHASNDAKSKADEQAGSVLYRDKGCGFCHGPDLSGTKKGPGLAAIGEDKEWPPERITKQIMDGGQKMPAFRDSLDDGEVGQLVVYLRAKDHPVAPAVPGAPQK